MKQRVPRSLRTLIDAKWVIKQKYEHELRDQFPPWYAMKRKDRTNAISTILIPLLEFIAAYLISYTILRNVEQSIVLAAVLRLVIAYGIDRLIERYYSEPWRRAHPECTNLTKEAQAEAISQIYSSVNYEKIQTEAVQLLRDSFESQLTDTDRSHFSPQQQKIFERLDLLQDKELLSSYLFIEKEDSPEQAERKRRVLHSIKEYDITVSEINAFLASRRT